MKVKKRITLTRAEVRRLHRRSYGQKSDYVDASLDRLFGKVERNKRVS